MFSAISSRENNSSAPIPDGAYDVVSPVNIKEHEAMTDVILIGATLVFFGLCFAYTRACDRL